MATAAQLAARRSNCLKSTGPRTARGKARSCRNSLKHGLRSKSALLPDEDPEPFRRLFAALQAEHQPVTPEAEQAVLLLAVSMWKLRRADRVEKQIWLSFDLKTAIAKVAVLRRYRSTIERALFQAADFLLVRTHEISKRTEASPIRSIPEPHPPLLRYHSFSRMLPVLELRNLEKHYPGHRAVNGISLQIPRGGFYSLLGPSGCGKTTTLRLVAGFEEPTSGQVLLNGTPVNGRKPYERNVSTVFQNYALFPHLTVAGNVEFGLKRRGAADARRQVRDMLELVQLTGKEARYPAQLSGGERQRVALARSLVLEPDVLLLDEPLAALDPQLRKQMRTELKAMQRRVGITFLFVTHDQDEALSMSDSIAVMNNGLIEQAGTPEEVYRKPRTRFVASFMGAVNWINGIGVRPEATKVERTPRADGERSCQATVTGIVFLGNCVHVRTRLPSGDEAVAELHGQSPAFQVGEAVHLCWDPAHEMSLA